MSDDEESGISVRTVVTYLGETKKPVRAGSAFLILIYGDDLGRKMLLDSQPLTLGRAPENGIQIDQESVSRRHCRVECIAGRHRIVDLDSTNGTFVNDVALTGKGVELQDGDQIKVGQTLFKFIMGDNVEAQYHEEIYRLMTIDALTNVYNKRFFGEALEKEAGRCQRYGRRMALILFDIDHFKRINDRYGHLAGDAILARIGGMLQEHLRQHDLAARIGGEEFAVILPEVGMDGAQVVAEKLRKLVEQTQFDVDGQVINVTISLGLATWEETTRSSEELTKQADTKLYEAKNNGRNRVCG